MEHISISDSLFKRNRKRHNFEKNNHSRWKKGLFTTMFERRIFWGKTKGSLQTEKVMPCRIGRIFVTSSLRKSNVTFKQVLFRNTGWDQWKASGIGQSNGCRLPGQLQTSCFFETQQKMVQFVCDVLWQTPYSPYIAHSNYHLFQSQQNSLHGENLNSLESCKIRLDI